MSCARPDSWNVRTTGSCHGRGQVIFETAVALVGVVLCFYTVIEVWSWLNTMIVERQEAFQASRGRAGQQLTAGELVNYEPPALRLIDGASPYGAPPSALPLEPTCEAGEALYEQARALMERVDELYRTQAAYQEELDQLSAELEYWGHRVADEDDDDDRDDMIRDHLRPRQERFAQIEAEIEAAYEEADAKQDEADALREQAEATCR